jgi:hypothetical protein
MPRIVFNNRIRFPDFAGQWTAQRTSMLSETHTSNLFADHPHQILDQVSDRMRSGLQNVEVNITVRSGRNDAEQQAKVVGNADPLFLQHHGGLGLRPSPSVTA